MTATVFSPTIDGVIAALLAPFFMSLGFFIWDTRWSGSAFALNLFKCNVASTWFAIMAGIRGFSVDGSIEVFTITSVGYLTLSSTLGIIIGDVLWLEALRLLGAKHVIVADSLKPFAAAILGRFILGEALHPLGYVGMTLTVIGVGIVAWEGQNSNSIAKCDEVNNKDEIHHSEEQQQQIFEDTSADKSVHVNLNEYKRGYVCAILNVLADSFGSLFTKQHGVGMTTWTINLIRFGFAGLILLIISIGMRFHQKWFVPDNSLTKIEEDADIAATTHIDDTGNTLRETSTTEASKKSKTKVEVATPNTTNHIQDNGNARGEAVMTEPPENNSVPRWFELPTLTTKTWLQITLGVAFVTFLCPALEKFALMQIALGLCAAVASVGPLYGVLMDWLFKSRRPTVIGCIGAVLAIGGVVVLCAYGI